MNSVPSPDSGQHLELQTRTACTEVAGTPSHATGQKWLTTLAASMVQVRDAALSAVSAIDGKVLYLYPAGDRIVVRAARASLEMRIEISAVHGAHTRIAVTCVHGRDVDRIVSGRVIAHVESILNPRAPIPRPHT